MKAVAFTLMSAQRTAAHYDSGVAFFKIALSAAVKALIV